ADRLLSEQIFPFIGKGYNETGLFAKDASPQPEIPATPLAIGKIVDIINASSPPQQDPDVLDTWFSSALWPHSTLGWPEALGENDMVRDGESRETLPDGRGSDQARDAERARARSE